MERKITNSQQLNELKNVAIAAIRDFLSQTYERELLNVSVYPNEHHLLIDDDETLISKARVDFDTQMWLQFYRIDISEKKVIERVSSTQLSYDGSGSDRPIPNINDFTGKRKY